MKIIRRYRGDGRVITREVPDSLLEMPPADPIREWGTCHRNYFTQGKSTIFKQWGDVNSYSNLGKSAARKGCNGPFRVEVYAGRRQDVRRHGRRQQAFRVVNKLGWRVHRGSQHSCRDVCETLNVEYAKWLMLKPDTPDMASLWAQDPNSNYWTDAEGRVLAHYPK
jgi:hypothetical protein